MSSLEGILTRGIIASTLAFSTPLPANGEKFDSVSDLVRSKAYDYIDHEVLENWIEVRGWVLRHEGPCTNRKAHIFVNLNGKFLSWMDNILDRSGETDSRRTLKRIDGVRGDINARGQSDVVIPTRGKGYPFAYSCEIAEDIVGDAVESYFEDRLSGTWRGLRIEGGDKKKTIRETFRYINDERDYGLPESVYERLLGQFIIESGGKKNARSAAGARGILQLMPDVRNECGISAQYATHRMAQIDCALNLLKRKYDYLESRIERAFPNIPEDKRGVLHEWLTTQAYHAGQGNIAKLLHPTDETGAAARELNTNYIEKYTEFSGEDMALFLLTHNYGRARIGPQAIKYGVDAQIGLGILQEYKETHGIE